MYTVSSPLPLITLISDDIVKYFLILTYMVVNIVKKVPVMRDRMHCEFRLLISVTIEMVYEKEFRDGLHCKNTTNCFRS